MKTQTAAHTPTPWAKTRYVSDHVTIFRDVTSPEGTWPVHEVIADVDDDCNRGEANAAFIVRAVNAHQELLRAAKEMKECLKHFSDTTTWDNAIAKAEGESNG